MALTTSDGARLAGVNKQTLRYYERRGLQGEGGDVPNAPSVGGTKRVPVREFD